MLVIGFKGKSNTSSLLVSLFDCEKLLLTNSFKGIDKDINNIAFKDRTIIMFGIDKNLINEIRIEPFAKINQSILSSSLDINKIRGISRKKLNQNIGLQRF